MGQHSTRRKTCRLCVDQCIEDKFHFLCVCRLYHNETVLLYDHVSELHPEFPSLNPQENFVYLTRYENREVAKYLEKAYICKYHLYSQIMSNSLNELCHR